VMTRFRVQSHGSTRLEGYSGGSTLGGPPGPFRRPGSLSAKINVLTGKFSEKFPGFCFGLFCKNFGEICVDTHLANGPSSTRRKAAFWECEK
jgi:hypothetical protein